ncbi:MAG: NAD(P)H-dependent oxidoreductase subunit E [Proteobacteria bacterium]|nr:MAG: NAD(P)H-dependent oxidoreductase subunit E [Pseudomonadota bacterium]
MSFKFSEENEKYFQNLAKRYPNKKALTLPYLWMVQYQEGWISLEAMEYIAKRTEQSAMDIYSIASFYTMFNLQKVGKYHIQLCKTLSCMLNGSESLLEYLEKKLNIKSGQTSEDGLFTISEVECLGNCGHSPCISLNGVYHDDLDAKKLDKILEDLK